MEPFFFESSGTELFAAYHPATDPSSRRGVVMCPPFGNEMNRMYRATHLLAERWTSKAHVLRFDYAATGDSFGDWEDAGPARWVEDIASASRELSDISGTTKLTLAGIRFGALLAISAAERTKANQLLLWDPVASGKAYLSELENLHQILVASHANLKAEGLEEIKLELCGVDKAHWMETEMADLSMPAALPSNIEQTSIIQTSNQPLLEDVMTAWRGDQCTIEHLTIDFNCAWSTEAEAIVNPAPVIEELDRCL